MAGTCSKVRAILPEAYVLEESNPSLMVLLRKIVKFVLSGAGTL